MTRPKYSQSFFIHACGSGHHPHQRKLHILPGETEMKDYKCNAFPCISFWLESSTGYGLSCDFYKTFY